MTLGAVVAPSPPSPSSVKSLLEQIGASNAILMEERIKVKALQEQLALVLEGESNGDPSHDDPSHGQPKKQTQTKSTFPIKASTTFQYLHAKHHEPNPDSQYDSDSDLEDRPYSIKKAIIPNINTLQLNSSGVFVEVPLGSQLSGLSDTVHSNADASARMEDSVMDLQPRMSFADIGSQEKMDVFRLAAVRRSMRHLEYNR